MGRASRCGGEAWAPVRLCRGPVLEVAGVLGALAERSAWPASTPLPHDA
jgi:hypothetical protein